MSKLFMSSKYINALYDLVEEMYYRTSEENQWIKSKLPFIADKMSPPVAKVYDRAYDLCNSMTTGFDDLWDFADFIYAITMVYFYHNDKDSSVFIDSGVKAGEKRVLVFTMKEKGVIIKFTMSSVGTKVLDVHVIRAYGKEMESTFKFINGENTYTSDNDCMLINTINEYTLRMMKDLYMEWIHKALYKEVYK